ncbi:hypothetical protein ACIXOK_02945 [Bacteroides fragilis]
MKRNIKGDWGLYCLLATVGACCILAVLKLYGLIAISWKYVLPRYGCLWYLRFY